jgi:alpha-beta hydrolase superfamily lysophospholipase
VAIVHGIGGHGGLFEAVAQDLAAEGWDVHAVDLPGHGRSPGRRGWIPAWSAFRSAVLEVLERIGADDDGGAARPFVLGHSLGGTIALDLALRQPERVRGVIVSNPALGAGGVAPWRLLLARSLTALWPGFSLSTGIPLSACSRDPAVLDRLAADPLCHSRCSARLATEFLATARQLLLRADRLRSPLLLLQSGADTITPPEPALEFFGRAGSVDKTLRLYPQSYHEIFDDLDRRQVLRDLTAWLAAREAHGP